MWRFVVAVVVEKVVSVVGKCLFLNVGALCGRRALANLPVTTIIIMRGYEIDGSHSIPVKLIKKKNLNVNTITFPGDEARVTEPVGEQCIKITRATKKNNTAPNTSDI